MESQTKLRIDYPDQDLLQRIQCFLRSQHFPAFRDLAVHVENGHVCLVGEVGSFYEKQVAINSCQRVAGVLSLVDQVTVSDPELSLLVKSIEPLNASVVDYVG
jgi:hypothetical protein